MKRIEDYRLDCNENEYRVAMKGFIMSDFDNEKTNLTWIIFSITWIRS